MDIKDRSNYEAEHIQVLEGLEAVRKRPGMYIGSTSIEGLHHLVYEVVDNSIDEAMAGYCTEISVEIKPGNVIKVQDDGRGIPVEIHPKVDKPAVEVVMTTLHAGGKFGGEGYKVSGGLHGVGVSVVNALTEWMEVEIAWKDGKVYKQKYERGIPQHELQVVGSCDSECTGTTIEFKPDSLIFEETDFEFRVLAQRLKELAFLNKGTTIKIKDTRQEEVEEEEFHFDGGLVSFVEYLSQSKKPILSEPIYIEDEGEEGSIEVAIMYHQGYNTSLYTFANNINTCLLYTSPSPRD